MGGGARGRGAGGRRSRTVPARGALADLARSYGILLAHTDGLGRRVRAREEAVLAALRALGAPVARPADASAALRARREEIAARMSAPAHVVREGRGAVLPLAAPAGGALAVTLRDERGAALPPDEAFAVRRGPRGALRLHLSPGMPAGVYALELEGRSARPAAPRRQRSAIIVSPLRCHEPPVEEGAAVLPAGPAPWGLFAPVYALRGDRGERPGAAGSRGRAAPSRGMGDFGLYGELIRGASACGARLVATLPCLASWHEDPAEPSPYRPVSRLFWNELFLDFARVPEWNPVVAAELTVRPPPGAELVDYGAEAAFMRAALDRMAAALAAAASPRRAALERFGRGHPHAADYARFRAVAARRREPWRRWPARLRDGDLRAEDGDPVAELRHLYAQWLAELQMARLARVARDRGVTLGQDLPLGVHPEGFDAWRWREQFVHAVSAGAPPDDFFTGGQVWAAPPLHPERLRAGGYGYVRACLAHSMRHAGLLRLDHVMSLHRLFWVPEGMEAAEGVYVTYPREELYALLALESRRHGTVVMGEDLGTVPPEVRPAMRRHGLRRSYVAQFAVSARARSPLAAPPSGAVAAVNTHDLYPWAGWCKGLDLACRRTLGLLDAAGLARLGKERSAAVRSLARELGAGERRARLAGRASAGGLPAPDPLTLFAPLARRLRRGAASWVLLNLEDFCGEERPQNVPGTGGEWPNWRRRMRAGLAEALRAARSTMGGE